MKVFSILFKIFSACCGYIVVKNGTKSLAYLYLKFSVTGLLLREFTLVELFELELEEFDKGGGDPKLGATPTSLARLFSSEE